MVSVTATKNNLVQLPSKYQVQMTSESACLTSGPIGDHGHSEVDL